MPEVADYIENTYKGGISKFRMLGARAQNKHLKAVFPHISDGAIRKQKMLYYRSKTVPIVPKNKPKPKPKTPSIAPLLTPDEPLPHSQGGGLPLPKIDLSQLDANQQTLFQIAWMQYITTPSPQWFNVLMSFLKETQQLKTQESKEWQALKQLSNTELSSLIKPAKYSPPATTAPPSTSSSVPLN